MDGYTRRHRCIIEVVALCKVRRRLHLEITLGNVLVLSKRILYFVVKMLSKTDTNFSVYFFNFLLTYPVSIECIYLSKALWMFVSSINNNNALLSFKPRSKLHCYSDNNTVARIWISFHKIIMTVPVTWLE